MFSGIVRYLGVVKSIRGKDLSKELTIYSEVFTKGCQVGDSISVNGVCLTIVEIKGNLALFDISSETLRKTSLGKLVEDSVVNIEESLRLGDKIDGHLVYGHVDVTAKLIEIQLEEDTRKYIFKLDRSFLPYLVSKGSVSVDGVSLTIGEVLEINLNEVSFSVYIIPHTYQNTIFRTYDVASIVNIEVDPLCRYAVNALKVLVS